MLLKCLRWWTFQILNEENNPYKTSVIITKCHFLYLYANLLKFGALPQTLECIMSKGSCVWEYHTGKDNDVLLLEQHDAKLECKNEVATSKSFILF